MTKHDSATSSADATEAAIQDLIRSRSPISQLQASSRPGVYAIYLVTPDALDPFTGNQDGLIYIGLSTNLAEREFEQHFASGNTGFSTLRRSLGAILKGPLTLSAIPRAAGPSETNVRNYRFVEKGEDRLTAWMRSHLEVGVHACADYEALESVLIGALKPVLNLTKWKNPDRKDIKRLRKNCADEARAARGR